MNINRFKLHLQGFLKYRSLLYNLVSRDIKIRYRRSFLGLLWTILNPLLMMIIITVIFSTLFKQTIPNYPIYYLSGYLMFQFNSETTTSALYSITSNAALMKKIYIPKYLFPLSKVLSGLVNLFFSLIAMFIVMLILQVKFRLTLLLILLPIFYVLLFSIGLGLILSTYTVFFRDLAHFYTVFVMAWLYFTPVFYPITILPKNIMKLMQLNPIYHYVSYMRELVLYGTFPGLKENMICFAMGIIFLLFGLHTFYKNQDKFILYI